jgi:hypothetical protein
MITEAMVIKGLACVGAWTVADKVIAPAAGFAGKKIGQGVGALVNKLDKNGKRTGKGKVGNDQATEQAIMALLAECDQAFSENDTKEEPDNVVTIVEEVKPEPMFDQKVQDWIRKCQGQYGGFANVVLE